MAPSGAQYPASSPSTYLSTSVAPAPDIEADPKKTCPLPSPAVASAPTPLMGTTSSELFAERDRYLYWDTHPRPHYYSFCGRG